MLIAHFLPPTFKRLPRRIASSPSCRLYAPEVSGRDKNFSPRGDMLDDDGGGSGGGDGGSVAVVAVAAACNYLLMTHKLAIFSRQQAAWYAENSSRGEAKLSAPPPSLLRVALQIGKKPPWRMAPSSLWQMAGQSLGFTASASADVAIISTVQFCSGAIWPDCRESRRARLIIPIIYRSAALSTSEQRE